jgi:hypothetical protein
LFKTIALLTSIVALNAIVTAKQITILHSFGELSPKDLSTAIVRIEYRGESNGELAPIQAGANLGNGSGVRRH